MTLTQQRLKELLYYDLATGVWIRLKTGRRVGSRTHGYTKIGVDGKRYYAHRLACLYVTGAWPTNLMDHKKTTTGGEAWSNLRPATKQQNAANSKRRVDNTSGYKGVYRYGIKWRAKINVAGKQVHLGTFANSSAAHTAYAAAAQKHFGQYARAA
jgi:hypothetical protein